MPSLALCSRPSRNHCFGHSVTRSTNVTLTPSTIRIAKHESFAHLPHPVRECSLPLPVLRVTQPLHPASRTQSPGVRLCSNPNTAPIGLPTGESSPPACGSSTTMHLCDGWYGTNSAPTGAIDYSPRHVRPDARVGRETRGWSVLPPPDRAAWASFHAARTHGRPRMRGMAAPPALRASNRGTVRPIVPECASVPPWRAGGYDRSETGPGRNAGRGRRSAARHAGGWRSSSWAGGSRAKRTSRPQRTEGPGPKARLIVHAGGTPASVRTRRSQVRNRRLVPATPGWGSGLSRPRIRASAPSPPSRPQ